MKILCSSLIFIFFFLSPTQVFSIELKCPRFFHPKTTALNTSTGPELLTEETVPFVSRLSFIRTALSTRIDVLEILHKLHSRFGSIFRLSDPISGKYYLMISDPKATRQILMETDSVKDAPFVKSTKVVRVLEKLSGKSNLFTSTGAEWRRQRKSLATAFTPNRLRGQDFLGQIESVVSHRMEDLRGQAAGAKGVIDVPLGEETKRLSLDLVMQLMFNYEIPNELREEFTKGLELAQFSVATEVFNPFARPLHELPTVLPYQKRLRKAFSITNQVIEDIIARFEADPESSTPFMKSLYAMAAPEGVDPKQNIKNQIITFIVAGHETTAHALAWALVETISKSDLKAKLEQSVRSGKEEEANQLIDEIWEETLRLHAPISALVREATRDVIVHSSTGDLMIKKGSTIFLNTAVLQTDENLWGLEKTGFPANEFHVDRFSAPNLDKHNMKGEDFQTFAFGCGPRVCIGAYMSKMEVRSIVRQLFSKFDISLNGSDGKIRASRVNQAVVQPTHIKLKPR